MGWANGSLNSNAGQNEAIGRVMVNDEFESKNSICRQPVVQTVAGKEAGQSTQIADTAIQQYTLGYNAITVRNIDC
jgi:hypothetical protein